jgi:hypothetical protein
MTIPRTLAVAGLAAVTLAAAAGCNLVYDTLSDGVVKDIAVTEIHIDGGSGNVVVIPDTSVTGLDLRRTVRYRGAKPAPEDTYRIEGGVVTVSTSCAGISRDCSASYELRVPPRGSGAGIAVTGSDGSGNVTVTGVGRVDVTIGSGNLEVTDAAGSVTAKSGSGNTRLADIAGDVTVNASSGNVFGRNLHGNQVNVRVSSGDVTLAVPGTSNVTAHTSSGNIEVTVPDHSCQVVATADSGKVNVRVTSDPTSAHTLNVSTGSGDITVKPV